jgi:hypothetical protein
MARYLLTDAMVRKAKPRAKSYRLFDGDGLTLRVSPTGAKSWQLRYRLHGKAQTLTIGKYDTFSLADARLRADKARKLAADGAHLTVDKRVQRLRKRAETATLFKGFAERWIAREGRRLRWSPDYQPACKTESYRVTVIISLPPDAADCRFGLQASSRWRHVDIMLRRAAAALRLDAFDYGMRVCRPSRGPSRISAR